MDKKLYHETSVTMDNSGVDPAYVMGWQTGYMHGTKLEEQRVTDAYEAGYNDGLAGKTDGFKTWVKQ